MKKINISKRNRLIWIFTVLLLFSTLSMTMMPSTNPRANFTVSTSLTASTQNDNDSGITHSLPSFRIPLPQTLHPTLKAKSSSSAFTEMNATLNATFWEMLSLQRIDHLITKEKLTGKGITVGIIDTGISEQAKNKIQQITRVTFARMVDVTTTPNPTIGIASDNVGTGTQLTSLISLIAPQVNLVIYKAARILPNNQKDSEKNIIDENETYLSRALTDYRDYLVSTNNDRANVLIINRALNTTNPSIIALLKSLIYEKKTTIVIPAGNNPTFSDYQMHPLSILPEVITVGALANQTTPLLGTGIGPRPNGLPGPDISSIGYEIPVLNYNGSYEFADGMHLPVGFVAATISLLLEKYPQAHPIKVKAALIKSAKLAPTLDVSIQGAGILQGLEALSTLKQNKILAMLPRAFTDHNNYYNLPIIGISRTYPIFAFYYDDTKNSSIPLENISIQASINPKKLISSISMSDSNQISNGVNIINLTISTTFDYVMDSYTGNISFSINDGEAIDHVVIKNTLRYEGGKILLDETKSLPDVGIPRGKHGSLSMFYHYLEQLGFLVDSVIGPEMNITPGTADVISKGSTLSGAIDNLNGNTKEFGTMMHDALIISEFSNPLSDEDQQFLNDWLSRGKPAMLIIPPNLHAESLDALNKTLQEFGITLSAYISTQTQASTRNGNSITNNDVFQFAYEGFTFRLDNELLRSRTLEVILTSNDLPVGVAYISPASGARMFILGSTIPLENLYVLSIADQIREENGIFPFLTSALDWILEPNRISVEITMQSTTVYLNEKITISITTANYFLQKNLKATIESPDDLFHQILLNYDTKTKSYEGEWIPRIKGEHVLWLDVRFPGKTANNGRFIINVIEVPLGLSREFISVLIIVITLVIVGFAYYQVRKSNEEFEQLFEEDIQALKKRSDQKEQESKRQLLLNVSPVQSLERTSPNRTRNIICPQCKTPAFNEKAKFCYKCGKEL